MQVEVVKNDGKKSRSIDFAAADQKVEKAILYYAVKAQRNNLRHGTVKVKSRGEVARTGKKAYRQKGSGNARHGAKSANIFVGGGNVHGPSPRSYNEKMNKKAKIKAYREVFKYLAQNNQLKIVEEFKFDKPSAKSASEFLNALSIKKAVVYVPADQENAFLSFRNLRDVKAAQEINLSLFDMLRFENVVMTASFFEQLKERYGL